MLFLSPRWLLERTQPSDRDRKQFVFFFFLRPCCEHDPLPFLALPLPSEEVALQAAACLMCSAHSCGIGYDWRLGAVTVHHDGSCAQMMIGAYAADAFILRQR